LKRDEGIGGVILFLFGGITVLLSLRMPIGTFRAAGTGLFPLLLGIILMILSGLFLLNLLLRKERELERKEAPVEATPRSFRPVIFFLGMMALAALFFNSLGYPLIAFLLMVALLKILGMKRWPINIFLSLATAAASYFLFVQWLKIPLPKGLLGI
jgi:putative tricarboxylic transport membrane protein